MAVCLENNCNFDKAIPKILELKIYFAIPINFNKLL